MQTPRIRPAVRILLIDEDDRVFLFKGEDPKRPGATFWAPVGGGIEKGETPEEAIRREVTEETGLTDVNLLAHIWNREHIISFNGELIHTKEKWFVARVQHFEIDTSGFSEIERKTTLGQHWWTLAELENSTELLTPRKLAQLLPDLLIGNYPNPPLSLGA
ncbi:MAG: NUDIX domain-containing protein [Actinomycetota bacterium]